MTRTPGSLLNRLQSDPDDESWSRFVDIYAPLLHGWLHNRFGLQHHDAVDLAQEVLITVLQKMPAFRYDPKKGSFRAWLYVVVSNHVKDFIKKESNRRKILDSAAVSKKLEQLALADSSLVKSLNEEHESRLVRRTLALIKSEFEENTWRAFIQLVFKGHKPVDVARSLGMSANAVRIAKFRVLGRLRQEIHDLMN